MVDEALSISAGSASAELRCRALHAACWLAGCRGDLRIAQSVGEQLVAESKLATLHEFEAKTLADLAWIARLSNDRRLAETRAASALEAALRSGAGGALVSAYTELALVHLVAERYGEVLQAAAMALTCQSGDDLSSSSVLRVAAPILLVSERRNIPVIRALALGVVEAALTAVPGVGIWPADVALVGGLVERVRSELRDRQPPTTEVDLFRLAQKLGSALAAGLGSDQGFKILGAFET